MDRRMLIAVAAVVAIAVIAIVVVATMGPPQQTGDGTESSVEIENFEFSPATLTVPVGTTVTWTNNDNTIHTVTFDSGPFPSSGDLGRGQTYSVTFDRAGAFDYHCTPHPSMVARVVVVQ